MLSLETVPISQDALDGIRDHARREQVKGNYEAVGFMAKLPDHVEIHVLAPMHNHAANPTEAFFVEVWEQYRTERQLSDNGYKIIGVYHSHPNSEAIPSKTDRTMARAGEVVGIYSVAFDDFRLYREEDGQLEPIGWEAT